jgi:hypothetical protein
VLDESSDDDDDLLVFTGAQFVQNFSNDKKNMVDQSLDENIFIGINKAAMRGCTKII